MLAIEDEIKEPLVQKHVIQPGLLTIEMKKRMIDERVSHLSKRSAYKHKGLRIENMNSSRKIFTKGPIKANLMSPHNFDLLSSNQSLSTTLPGRKAVRPQTAPAHRAMKQVNS